MFYVWQRQVLDNLDSLFTATTLGSLAFVSGRAWRSPSRLGGRRHERYRSDMGPPTDRFQGPPIDGTVKLSTDAPGSSDGENGLTEGTVQLPGGGRPEVSERTVQLTGGIPSGASERTVQLSGGGRPEAEGTVMLPGGGLPGASGTVQLEGLGAPPSPGLGAGATVALTMDAPGLGGATAVVSQSRAPARARPAIEAAATRARADDGPRVAARPTPMLRHEGQGGTVSKAAPGGMGTWVIALAVIAVIAGVAVGLLI